MPVQTQAQFAEQMVAQIRLLKPSISAEVGTPERLILDVTSGALSESSIDLIGLQNALNVDTKFGSNLTNFLAIFGFARQEATAAQGFVVFSRKTEANTGITIPSGVIVKANEPTSTDGTVQEFQTTTSAILAAGETSTAPVPIKALTTGKAGDVPAGAITIMSNIIPILGITEVNNPTETTGGKDQEDDNSLKVRFRNTVFRNLAGTEDQFLALAVSTAFSTKANVIGPISRYQEYVEVPGLPGGTEGDDTTQYAFGGGTPYSGTPAKIIVRGKTTARILEIESTDHVVATNPIKIYADGDNPKLVFTGTVETVINEREIKLSGTPTENVERGWVLIGALETEKYVNQWTTALSDNPFAKNIWTALPVFVSDDVSGISKYFFREGVDFDFNFPAKLQGDTLRAMIDGTGLDPREGPVGDTQPNVTFTNVFVGDSEAIKAVSPGDIVLLEYSYTSTASRNSLEHNVTNCVDVYIDGANPEKTSTIFTAPISSSSQQFVDTPNSMYYYENYRRAGEPTKRPIEGNTLTPLFNVPLLEIPQQIVIGENKYFLGVHYWLVNDVSEYAGTIRARDGIEWSETIKGSHGGAGEGHPEEGEEEPTYQGEPFSEFTSPTEVEIEEYSYDRNIPDLQATLEGARQITTDTLAHKGFIRYFKLDLTVIYAPQATPATVNANIQKAVATFLANQYFGSVIRLSDLLQVVHQISGVENVRWSNDVPNTEDFIRVWETDINGKPLLGISSDRVRWGSASEKEIQSLYIAGEPTEGTFTLQYYTGKTSAPIKVVVNAGEDQATVIETAINAILEGGEKVVVTEDDRSVVGVTEPLKSFRVEFSTNGKRPLPKINNTLVMGGFFVYDSDFFFRDDELPALPTGMQPEDTVPGLIIRSRAQNVFQKA